MSNITTHISVIERTIEKLSAIGDERDIEIVSVMDLFIAEYNELLREDLLTIAGTITDKYPDVNFHNKVKETLSDLVAFHEDDGFIIPFNNETPDKEQFGIREDFIEEGYIVEYYEEDYNESNAQEEHRFETIEEAIDKFISMWIDHIEKKEKVKTIFVKEE